MLVADKVKPVCKIQTSDIFVISSVTFIPFEVCGFKSLVNLKELQLYHPRRKNSSKTCLQLKKGTNISNHSIEISIAP